MSSIDLSGLVEAVRNVASAPVGELSDSVVADELVQLRHLADAAEAAYVSRLAVFDARGIGQSRDVLSTRQWLRHRAHVGVGETSRALKTAHGLGGLPVVQAALAAGDIRRVHADAVVDAASLLGPDVIAGCQDALVEAARVDEPSKLRAALRGLGAATENRRAVREAERRDQGRWLDVTSTFDGAVHVAGVLGAEDGAVVTAAIEALSAPDSGHRRAEATGAGGAAGESDAAGFGRDFRSAAQRRADALVEVCRRQLDSGALPARGGEGAHVAVVTDLATLEARAGGFGELADGTVLRGETVRRLACDAKVTRVVVGPESRPLDVGRAQRTATAAQRQALRIRDGGCRFPGCDRPSGWTQAHHVVWWAHGGQTDVDDMILLCKQHHTTVHEGAWQVNIRGQGQFEFTNPRGQLVPAPRTEPTRHIVTRLVGDVSAHAREGPTADPQNIDHRNTERQGLDPRRGGADAA